jgi:hypothetical protein
MVTLFYYETWVTKLSHVCEISSVLMRLVLTFGDETKEC